MGKKKQTDEKLRKKNVSTTHRQLLAHKIGHRYHLLISRRAQQQKKNRELERIDTSGKISKKKSGKVGKMQSKAVKSTSNEQYYPTITKDDVLLRRSERLASMERIRMVDNVTENTEQEEIVEEKEQTITTPSLPDLESTINLDHAYSKQFDCKEAYENYQFKSGDKNIGKERKNGKQRKGYEDDRKSLLTYWSTENGNFCERYSDRSRSASAGSSSSCSSTLSNPRPIFNCKNRKLIYHRRSHLVSKGDKKSLKRRKSKQKFIKCKEIGEKIGSDDENEIKRRKKVFNVKNVKEAQETKQGSKYKVENIEDPKKISSTRRRGRPPKMQVGTSNSWNDESDQWRKKEKTPSKWAALTHEQQCAAIKGWKYLLQVAFNETQLNNFWDEVESEFFKVQVKYIRHQNQNDWPVDEEYLTVLRNTVVWKHLRCHHETILKQLRKKLQDLSWRHAEMRSLNPNSDRFPNMRKQMELLRCIESILNGGHADANLNANGSARVASSKLTEILQTIDEIEKVEDVDIVAFNQNDYKMVDDILIKLQRPGSPVTVMPLGGETVAVPLPVNHELCDSLLRESQLACLAPDVVEAYLQIPNYVGELDNSFFYMHHLSLHGHSVV